MNFGRLLLVPVLFPLSLLFSAVAYLRGLMFDLKILPSSKPEGTRVVSIGNLTSGGTGKTPIVQTFLAEALKRGQKVGLVSRGFGRQSRGLYVVDMASDPAEVGDETLMLKQIFPSVPMVVAESRREGAWYLREKFQVDLIFADDAFQHRFLARDVDLVLVDASEPQWHYMPLPLGYGREGFRALSRATAVVLTKQNFVPTQTALAVEKQIKLTAGVPLFKCGTHLSKIVSLLDNEPASNLKSVLLVSSIARPRQFRILMEQSGLEVLEHIEFPDHHLYSKSDLKEILAEAKRVGAAAILVTQKDAVKFENLEVPSGLFFVAQIRTEIDRFGELYDLATVKVH